MTLKTTGELREYLLSLLCDLREGKITPQRARRIVKRLRERMRAMRA